MTREEWITEIRAALKAQDRTPSGPAGETPVGRVAEAISQIDPTAPEMAAVAQALTAAISDAAGQGTAHWKALSNMLRFASIPGNLPRDSLVELLQSARVTDPDVRAVIMMTLVDLGYRFTPRDLDKEVEVKHRNPMQWMEVKVRSGYEDDGFRDIAAMLRNGELRVSELSLRLPDWHQRLGPKLVQAATQWLEALRSPEDRQALLRFFDHSGIKLPVGGATPAPSLHEQATVARAERLLQPDASYLKSTKARKFSRLNGSAAPDVNPDLGE
jgi:hypothetical protein